MATEVSLILSVSHVSSSQGHFCDAYEEAPPCLLPPPDRFVLFKRQTLPFKIGLLWRSVNFYANIMPLLQKSNWKSQPTSQPTEGVGAKQ